MNTYTIEGLIKAFITNYIRSIHDTKAEKAKIKLNYICSLLGIEMPYLEPRVASTHSDKRSELSSKYTKELYKYADKEKIKLFKKISKKITKLVKKNKAIFLLKGTSGHRATLNYYKKPIDTEIFGASDVDTEILVKNTKIYTKIQKKLRKILNKIKVNKKFVGFVKEMCERESLILLEKPNNIKKTFDGRDNYFNMPSYSCNGYSKERNTVDFFTIIEQGMDKSCVFRIGFKARNSDGMTFLIEFLDIAITLKEIDKSDYIKVKKKDFYNF